MLLPDVRLRRAPRLPPNVVFVDVNRRRQSYLLIRDTVARRKTSVTGSTDTSRVVSSARYTTDGASELQKFVHVHEQHPPNDSSMTYTFVEMKDARPLIAAIVIGW